MVSGPIRRRLKRGVRHALSPARRLAAAAAARDARLARRIGGWTWLWQPGWSRTDHERFYARGPDPYGFDSKPGEQAKYRETLALLGGRRYPRALEVGCSEGAFTELLLPLCDEVVATEVAEGALDRARRRLAGRDGVGLERRDLPFDFPEGTFDLVVCSDVLYLWEHEALAHGLDRFARCLRPGGVLLLLHYLGEFGQVLPARTVHELAVRRAPGLGLSHERRVDLDYRGPQGEGYLADVFSRPRS